MAVSLTVQSGRTAIEQYRTAHAALYVDSKIKDIPAAHTPLLEIMKTCLQQAGFKTIDEYFKENREENAKTLGFTSVKELFEKGTVEQKQQYREMWK